MKIKLAEALLRRKELNDKVAQLKAIKDKDLFEVKGKRQKLTEDLDDIILQVPLLTSTEVTAAYDYHARALRLIDASIQQANWTTEIDVESKCMEDYVPQQSERKKIG
jgi:hypothetical protein